jgi:hypothetical protein
MDWKGKAGKEGGRRWSHTGRTRRKKGFQFFSDPSIASLRPQMIYEL